MESVVRVICPLRLQSKAVEDRAFESRGHKRQVLVIRRGEILRTTLFSLMTAAEVHDAGSGEELSYGKKKFREQRFFSSDNGGVVRGADGKGLS